METKNYNGFADHFSDTPLAKSPLDHTTPERLSSFSEPVSSFQSPSSSDQSPSFTRNGQKKNKNEGKGSSFAHRIRDHVRMGPKLSETVKGKLWVGAKILRHGGRENVFREVFGVIDGEKLLKASQCYLSTTAGPIAGILFVSTEKVAFWSERSIAVHSSSGEIIRTPYKITVPVKKIRGAYESENVKNPEQKYIQVVTHDNFEFWFMGFVRYEKAFINLQKAISLSR